ncbi:LysR family transcriptional regulator [Eggerthellaceae bacterium 24-137]
MDTKVFGYVVSLAEEGSYGRAAKRSFITSQGLASAVERLEQALGAKLFEADHRGVSLTEYGQVVYRFSVNFEESHRAMVDRLEELRRREKRLISLAYSTGLLNVITREEIKRFDASNSHDASVDILRAVYDHDCEGLLLEKACDFALLNNPVAHPQLLSVPLHKDMMFLWAPEDSWFARKPCLSLADLAGCEVFCLAPDEYTSLSSIEHRVKEEAPGCELMYADQMIEVLERAMIRGVTAITVRSHTSSFPNEGYVGVPIVDLTWGFSLAYRQDRALRPWEESFVAYISSLAMFHC